MRDYRLWSPAQHLEAAAGMLQMADDLLGNVHASDSEMALGSGLASSATAHAALAQARATIPALERMAFPERFANTGARKPGQPSTGDPFAAWRSGGGGHGGSSGGSAATVTYSDGAGATGEGPGDDGLADDEPAADSSGAGQEAQPVKAVKAAARSRGRR